MLKSLVIILLCSCSRKLQFFNNIQLIDRQLVSTCKKEKEKNQQIQPFDEYLHIPVPLIRRKGLGDLDKIVQIAFFRESVLFKKTTREVQGDSLRAIPTSDWLEIMHHWKGNTDTPP